MDACLSYHNHITGFKVETLARVDREGLEDETIGRPYPRVPADPGEFFQYWLTHGAVPGHSDGSPFLSYFALERTYWEERNRPNLLLVHYNDLKRDLEGEMRRLAAFLDITVHEEVLPALVHAAQFETMREEGDKLTPHVTSMFMGGAERFFNKGTNRRWEGVFSAESLALYQRKLAQDFLPTARNGSRTETPQPNRRRRRHGELGWTPLTVAGAIPTPIKTG
jgi:aryl sulfotransferase